MRYVVNVDKRLKVPDELAQKFWSLPVFIDFQGDVNEESAKKFIDNLKVGENAAIEAGQEILPVTINSYGGSVYACLGMIDAMKQCTLPIATIVESKAMSCGAYLFTNGAEGHRYIAPNATVMIHPVSLGSYGKINEIKTNAKEGDRLNEKMFQQMAENCGHKDDYFKKILEKEHINADWYLDPRDCLKHNIANKIGVPTMTVDISLSYKLA